jgi:16S rRNA (adenine(1408)-N(1))-methyltransferase
VAEPPDNWTQTPLIESSLHTGEGIVIDIGTGDGLFAYQCALQNPKKFYIGIDANVRPLEIISEKIHRKPAKGGAPNVLFLQASVEDLPAELDGIADEVHIHFPWGSLLRALALGDKAILANIRRLCSTEALLEVTIALDADRDRSEIDRLGLPPFSLDYIESELKPNFREAGFEIVETGEFDPANWNKLQTSWARRLSGNPNRRAVYLIAKTVEPDASHA